MMPCADPDSTARNLHEIRPHRSTQGAFGRGSTAAGRHARRLHEDLILRWTYHSNAIEGNTLTLNETKVVLEGITIGGKSLREHFEVINHKDAIFYVEDLGRGQEALSEWQIKNLHQL